MLPDRIELSYTWALFHNIRWTKLRFAEVDLTDGCLMNVRATRTLRVMSDYGTTASGEVRARNWEVRLSLKNRPRQPGLSGPTSADSVAKVEN